RCVCDHGQRTSSAGVRRRRHAAPVRASRRARSEWPEVRVWPVPVRCLHRPHRRSRRALVCDAGVHGPRARDDARGPGHPRASPSTPAGIHRRAGCPVRVLHQRHDHDSRGAAEAESEAERVRGSLGARWKPLPLRHPHANPARDPPGRSSMTPTTALASSRREFLKSTGAVIVTFAWPTSLGAQPARETSAAGVDAWLAIAADGAITLFTGKVEIGTGVSTALAQIVAEELDARVERVGVIQGDTERTPNQGYTAGSKTIQQGGPPSTASWAPPSRASTSRGR